MQSSPSEFANLRCTENNYLIEVKEIKRFSAKLDCKCQKRDERYGAEELGKNQRPQSSYWALLSYS